MAIGAMNTILSRSNSVAHQHSQAAHHLHVILLSLHLALARFQALALHSRRRLVLVVLPHSVLPQVVVHRHSVVLVAVQALAIQLSHQAPVLHLAAQAHAHQPHLRLSLILMVTSIIPGVSQGVRVPDGKALTIGTLRQRQEETQAFGIIQPISKRLILKALFLAGILTRLMCSLIQHGSQAHRSLVFLSMMALVR